MKRLKLISGFLILMIGCESLAQEAQQQRQDPLAYLGVQCGNAVDTTSIGCYIGTLGTLVTDGSNDYFLSNNHVLARSNAASIGEDILHVAATACDPNAIHVGELAAYVPIQTKRRTTNTVDAALARVTPYVSVALDANGRVLHVGDALDFSDAFPVENTTVAASIGMAVKKSGRTTGLTSGVVSALSVNVYVNYDSGRALFIDQFVVSDGSFSDSGDSGSLIVTSGNEPVGLLFAGSSSSTIGNPIGYVLDALGAELGGVNLSFGSSGDPGIFELSGGSSSPSNGNNGKGGGKKNTLTVSEAAIAHARGIRDRFETEILSVPGVEGSGIGLSADKTRPVIQIYTSVAPAMVRGRLPNPDGIEVEVFETGEFVAY